MGDDPLHWEGVGKIPTQGVLQSDREITLDRGRQRVGILPAGGSDGGGRTSVVGDLRLLTPEHSHTVYCDQAHYVPVSGGGAETGTKGVHAVVGTGWSGCGGYADGGSGGGMYGEGGGYGQDRDGDKVS